MVNKKKLVKSKGKWIVASYAVVMMGMVAAGEVHAQEEVASERIENLAETNSQGTDSASAEAVTNEEESVSPSEEMVAHSPAAQVNDGTVELENSFNATTPASEQAVTEALTSPDYLNREYKVFPTPQKVEYGTDLVRLDKGVNIVMQGDLDIYTRNRLKSVLQANQVSYATTNESVANSVNVLLGVHGTDSAAQTHQAESNISSDLYDKIDAYSLVIKGNAISIVGKDTDAVFHGLTTLKHMLNESAVPVLREVKVEDFAHIRNRGFIEGYYGNPWSNEDRAELMRYGGDLKMTQYFFAPKDDVYHNSQWRDLYPEEKLAEIRELARVGNQNKTRYVWTLHPFMHRRVRFDSNENYQADLQIIKNKFTQLMGAGVREFGILADDAPLPVGGYDSYNRLMNDLTGWLTEKQATYSGLKKEMIFVPADYMGVGTSNELRSLNADLPESSNLTLTGGRIWGEASQNFLNNLKRNLTQNGAAYRPVQLWINWPCTDNSKDHLILGGGEKFLHPNIDPSLVAGIMLNPMQQSEPSKIALFSAAEYTWNVWKSEAHAQDVNAIAFNFAETGKFTSTPTAAAFRELGKHMINQDMDRRVVKLEESVELAPKLTAFMTKLRAGEDVAVERAVLRSEFKKLKDAAQLYKASGNERMKGQIMYWLDNTIDQMNALDALLTATEHLGTSDVSALWENYYQGLTLYNQSRTHKFHYVNEFRHAELGVQHIRPFILNTLDLLAKEIEKQLNPDHVVMSFISNRSGAEGDIKNITDGNLTTEIIFKNPAVVAAGDYAGLAFNKLIKVNQLAFALGRTGNVRDTFATADIQYLNDQDQWVKLEGHQFVGNEPIIQLSNLNVMAKAVRIIGTSNNSNKWFGIREIAVNRPLEKANNNVRATITHSNTLIYKGGTSHAQILDGRDNTEAMLANSNTSSATRDTTPEGAWVQLNLEAPTTITKVRLVQGRNDKLAEGVIEYSTNGSEWTELEKLTGQQTKEITTNITARYIRIRNERTIPLWWRIADFSIEARTGTTEYTDTNANALGGTKVFETLGRYEMVIPVDATLAAGQYLGLKLERLHELANVTFTGELNTNLNVYYSPNLVEWHELNNVTTAKNARYIRIVNKTNTTQAIGATAMVTETKEIHPTQLESTTMGISAAYGANDVRRLNNLEELFDGVYNNFVTFSDYPRENGNIVLKFGTERSIKTIRAYVQDGTQNYLRDGKIQVSQDGETWTDVVVVGDGVENERRDDSLTDGWKHDSNLPGNRYIEGMLDTPVKANYLRVHFTANYMHRFVGFSEIVINNGEFVKTVNDPTVATTAGESHRNTANQIIDGDILTTYKVNENAGEMLYHLSEKTQANHIRLISNVPTGANVKVFARVVKQADNPEMYATTTPTTWLELGNITSSFQTFAIRQDIAHLLDVKLVWENGKPEVYELATFFNEVATITTEAQTYSEPTTNISVTFPAGELAAIKGIKANAVAPEQSAQVPALKDKDHVLYDIEAVDAEGADVDITQPAVVKIPVPTGKTVEKVLYLPETGPVTELAFTIEENHAVFNAPHFSHYALVFRAAADNTPTPNNPTPEVPKPGETPKPDTTPTPEVPKPGETPKPDTTPTPEVPKPGETPKPDTTPTPEVPKPGETPKPDTTPTPEVPKPGETPKPDTTPTPEVPKPGETPKPDTTPTPEVPKPGETPKPDTTPTPEVPKPGETPKPDTTPTPEVPKPGETPKPNDSGKAQTLDKPIAQPTDEKATEKPMMKADQTQSSTSEKLPETGEEAHYAIFGVAALSILAGLGMVAKRKEQ